jgi:F0F1-type ATP synthase membrane subunit b/b'
MKKLLFAAILLLAPRVHAQPEYTDEDAKKAAVTHEAAELGSEAQEEEEGDPSEHFNFTNFSWMGKDEWGGPYGDGKEVDKKGVPHREEEPMSPPFVFMLLNFALLLLILAKWGRPAARKIAETRHEQIKSALDEAKKLRDEAAKKLSDYESRIKDVDAEVVKLMEGIRADAEADKKRILEAAERQAAQMKRDAELRIAAEIELARAQLAREVTAAAATATEKLLRDKTTPDDQKKLVSTFLNGMGGN